ncbi:MAG: redoxin family protein [Chloroflexota bacterium]|nr:redoxin family protein [Chloroflexota bacterium]
MRNLRWLLVPVVVLPLTLLLFHGFGRDPREIPSPLIGKPAPSFSLVALDGKSLTADQLRGRPYVLNFWASWCIPACVDEHPVLLEAERRYGDDVQIVGIVYNDSPGAARAFLDRYGDGGWPQLTDEGGRLAVEYGVTGPPESYFVDAAGIVRAKQFGPLTVAVMDQRFSVLLAARAER